MLDDLRRHDPTPTEEERAWIDCDLIAVGALAVTAVALAAIVIVTPGEWSRTEPSPRVAAAER